MGESLISLYPGLLCRCAGVGAAQSEPGQCWLLLLLLPHPLPAQPTTQKASFTSCISCNHPVRGGGATWRVLPCPGTVAQTVLVLALNLPHRHHSTAPRHHFPSSLHAHARGGGATPCSKLLNHRKSPCGLSPFTVRALQGAAAQQPLSVFVPLQLLCPRGCFLPPRLASARVLPPLGSPPDSFRHLREFVPLDTYGPRPPIMMTRTLFSLPHRPRALEGRDRLFPHHVPSARVEVPAHGRHPLVSRRAKFALAVITQHQRPVGTETYFLTCWRLEVKTKVWAGWVPSDASLFGLRMAIFSLRPHLVFPLCASVS